MKKLVILMLLVAIAFAVTSCTTTYDKNMYMDDPAAFTSEEHGMWTRPLEMGYEIIGDVEGTAEYSMLFGVIPMGDAPAIGFNVFGFFGNQNASNPGVKFASYDACQTVGADGIYITSVYTESKKGLFVNSELVTVKGKALKLVDLGTVDQERVDTVRYLNAAGGLDKGNIAPNVSEGGIFGGLSNLFVFD